MNLEAQIEAILYYKAEPTSFKSLAEILGESEEKIRESVQNLKNILTDRGLTIIDLNNTFEIRTSPAASNLIEKLIKDEDNKELTKSALETLSIVLYKGPISRRDIDFIRGVNSSFILRTLASRGLVKRTSNGKENKYETTTELLAHLGIQDIKELPEYEIASKTLDKKLENLAINSLNTNAGEQQNSI